MLLEKTKKNELLDILKKIKLDEKVITDEQQRKWYQFGAYDALRIVSEVVKNLPENKK